jgi:hypothetical protein
MNVLKMTASDPNYQDWNWLLQRRCEAINAHVAWDTRWICELPEVERLAMVAELDGETVTAFEELSR